LDQLKANKYISALILITVAAVSLLITPGFSYEPVDLPKFWVLGIGGISVFIIVFSQLKDRIRNLNRLPIFALSLFILQMLIVIIFSGGPFNQQFYGTFGRNTGFVSYLSLVGLFLGSMAMAESKFVQKLAYLVMGIGFISVLYDTLQTFKLDPINWSNPYNPIIGFLGNPDFESSFLGIAGSVVLATLLRSNLKKSLRACMGIFYILIIWIIVRSAAQQGILVLAAGSVFIILIWLRAHHFKFKTLIFTLSLFTSGILAIITVFGTLKIGPLGSVLYKTSVRQRGFYWNAALNMMKKKPLTGVGFDSYGDWYFQVRSTKAAIITPTVQSNAAHNIFLDVGSNGGWILFTLYLILTLLVGFYGIRFFKRATEFDWAFTGIFGAWLGYEAQSIVSINQLGVGVIGWTLGGTILGYEFLTRKVSKEPSSGSNTRSKKLRRTKVPVQYSITFFIATLIVGLPITTPMFLNDLNYRKALSSSSELRVYQAATAKPIDTQRTLQAAQLLANNKLFPQSRSLADLALKVNPRYYNALQIKYELTPNDSPEKNKLKAEIYRLNPNWKAN
jgi:O-antigen ligase